MHPLRQHLLVVEDDPDIAELLRIHLQHAGFVCAFAGDAQGACTQVFEHPPDLVLLDWMLPDMSGDALVKRWRIDPETKSVPIIMLTARSQEVDKLQGLAAGADDYVTKPFSPKELIARVRAVLMRSRRGPSTQAVAAGVLVVGAISLDLEAHRASIADQTLALSPTEFRFLKTLMQHPEKALSRQALLHMVWGEASSDMDERTVDVQIKRIREALALHSPLAAGQVQTVRGLGYRFSHKRDSHKRDGRD